MLKTLKLVNYRQHQDTLIHFGPGVNTIIGANASGKSSIAEAIEFALFGAKALRDSGDAYVTDGKTNGSATVLFEVGSDLWQVGRDRNDALMKQNGEERAKYKANVTKHVAAVTGVNQTGFRLGHYVRQKELGAFSQLRAGKRQETIERMLKIHAVDKVLERLKKEVDALQLSLEQKLRVSQDLDRLQEELTTAECALAEVLGRQTPDLTEVDRSAMIVAERAVASASVADPSSAIRRRDQLLQLTDPSMKVAELEQAVETAVHISDDTFAQLQLRLRELQELEVKAAEMKPIREELERELLPVERRGVPIDPVESRTAISVAAAHVAAVSKLRGMVECPTCLREIADVDEVIRRLQDSLDSAKADGEPRIKAYTEALASWKVEDDLYRTYVAAVKRRTELQTKYVEVSYDATEKAKIEDETSRCNAARTTLIGLEHELDKAKLTLTQFKNAASQIEELNRDIKELEDTRAEIPELQAKLDALKEDVTAKELLLSVNRKMAMDNATEQARLEGQIVELRKSVTTATELRSAVLKISEELATAKMKFDVFLRFKRYLTAKIRPMIETVAETLFHKVTMNRYAAYQLASDYEVLITTHHGFVRKLTTISGSENDLANLCLRLAIATLRSNRLVGNLGFIILDEITSSFDDARTRQTLEGLMQLRDIIPQIINISHKPVEIGFADKLITLKEVNGKTIIS